MLELDVHIQTDGKAEAIIRVLKDADKEPVMLPSFQPISILPHFPRLRNAPDAHASAHGGLSAVLYIAARITFAYDDCT